LEIVLKNIVALENYRLKLFFYSHPPKTIRKTDGVRIKINKSDRVSQWENEYCQIVLVENRVRGEISLFYDISDGPDTNRKHLRENVLGINTTNSSTHTTDHTRQLRIQRRRDRLGRGCTNVNTNRTFELKILRYISEFSGGGEKKKIVTVVMRVIVSRSVTRCSRFSQNNIMQTQ